MPDRRYKLLAIDDDPMALRLLEEMLNPYDYDVVLLNANRNLIETIRKEKPDLILLDIMMPLEDGYTLLNRIKETEDLQNIPVIMVTAVSLEDNKLFASICGASAYLTKPVKRQVLIDTINCFLPGSVASG